MVIPRIFRDKTREEGREEGREENNAEWEEWLKRREEASRNKRPFNEPSPAERIRTKS